MSVCQKGFNLFATAAPVCLKHHNFIILLLFVQIVAQSFYVFKAKFYLILVRKSNSNFLFQIILGAEFSWIYSFLFTFAIDIILCRNVRLNKHSYEDHITRQLEAELCIAGKKKVA